jgi:hypothetical protein
MTDPAPLETRLRKNAEMLRAQNVWLFEPSDGVDESLGWGPAHCRDCVDRDHYGCNIVQSVENLEEAAERIVSLHQQLAASTAMVEPLLRRAEAAEQDLQAAEARIATLEQQLAATDQEAGR